MSEGLVARLRTPLDEPADFADVLAGDWHTASAADLAQRPIRLSSSGTVPFGELFDVRGAGDGTIRFIGDLRHANNLGAGLSGGEVVVDGAIGNETGARMRRGTIAVTGDAGTRTGLAAIAGSIILFGAAGEESGMLSKRGSIVALGSIVPPPTYRLACTYAPPYLRLVLLRLRHRFGLSVSPLQLDGLYDRYSGDFAELGRGEILRCRAP